MTLLITIPKTVTEEVIQERAKQVALGFTAEHDDEHQSGELRDAAAFMLYPSTHAWPFIDGEPSNLTSYRRRMIIAAAFCIAEAERSDRYDVAEKAKIQKESLDYAIDAISKLNGETLMNLDKLVKARLKELKKEEKKAAKKKGKK